MPQQKSVTNKEKINNVFALPLLKKRKTAINTLVDGPLRGCPKVLRWDFSENPNPFLGTADSGIGRLRMGCLHMHTRRIAIIGAMIAGLALSGCASPNSSQDDGWKLIVAKDYQAAQAYYQNKLAEDPSDPYVNLNLGVTYEELGNTDLAVTHYQLAVANGKDAKIQEVTQDGNVMLRSTTVSEIAQENLATLGS